MKRLTSPWTFIAAWILFMFLLVKPGCHKYALEKCDAICAQKGLECAGITVGLIDKGQCKEKSKPPAGGLRRR